MAEDGINRLAQFLASNEAGSDGVAKALGGSVRLRLRSELPLPELTFRPFELGPDGQPKDGASAPWNPLTYIRPELVAETPLGEQVIAPYGRPTGRYRLQALGIAVGLAGGVARVLGFKSVGRGALILGAAIFGAGELKRRIAR